MSFFGETGGERVRGGGGVGCARRADSPDLVFQGSAEEAEPARRKVLQLRAVRHEHRVGLLELAHHATDMGEARAHETRKRRGLEAGLVVVV